MAITSLAAHFLPAAGKFSKSNLQKGLQHLSNFSQNSTIQKHQDKIHSALNAYGKYIKSGQGLTATQMEAVKHKIVTQAGGNLSSNDKENIKSVLNFYSQKRLRQIEAAKQMGRLRADAYSESAARQQHDSSMASVSSKNLSEHSASINEVLKKNNVVGINKQANNRHTTSVSSIRPGGATPKSSVGIRPTGIALVK